ncbi:hypothetical protein KIV65_gp06 [Mycobacterium phage Anthony]|uniref:Uncharacterized protein n=1 Tax=Mycobacterium phage Anthony TaxID=2599857 RepID=A0A5J6THW1_9CAUD|nr:hypothetical protein KIV65_gp06 [Mycobacterium phage Anthony]QFG10461.1 hypothetical protein PBI_ANTHONY_91 [Mycobacterium phage Anthony]
MPGSTPGCPPYRILDPVQRRIEVIENLIITALAAMPLAGMFLGAIGFGKNG